MTAPFIGTALPDFTRVRRFGKALSGLLAIKPTDQRYAEAQNALVLTRALFDQELGELQEQINKINAEEQSAATQQPDLGPLAAGRLGAAQALSFGLAKPIAKAIPGGASPEDIEAQSQILQQRHSTASAVGTGAGIATGALSTLWALRAIGTVAKIGQARTSMQANRELAELRKVERAIKEHKLGQLKGPAKPQGPLGTTVRETAPPDVPNLDTPTFLRRRTPLPSERVAAEGAKAAAKPLTAKESARARFFRQQGFSEADAEQMARQGVAANKKALEKLLGRRLSGPAWQ